jgi:hypothetical protein
MFRRSLFVCVIRIVAQAETATECRYSFSPRTRQAFRDPMPTTSLDEREPLATMRVSILDGYPLSLSGDD